MCFQQISSVYSFQTSFIVINFFFFAPDDFILFHENVPYFFHPESVFHCQRWLWGRSACMKKRKKPLVFVFICVSVCGQIYSLQLQTVYVCRLCLKSTWAGCLKQYSNTTTWREVKEALVSLRIHQTWLYSSPLNTTQHQHNHTTLLTRLPPFTLIVPVLPLRSGFLLKAAFTEISYC